MRRAQVLVACFVLSFGVIPTQHGVACEGDCDGEGTVTISELIALVNIALGSAARSACPNGILPDETVDISFLIRAVTAALGGCPQTATPTTVTPPTVQPTPTSTPQLQSGLTGSDGSISFSNIGVKVIDFGTQHPLPGIHVTVVGSGDAEGLVIADPSGNYASELAAVSDLSATATIAPSNVASSIPLTINLVSAAYISAQDSTLPFILTGSTSKTVFDYLGSQFVTCNTVRLDQLEEYLRNGAKQLAYGIIADQLVTGHLLVAAPPAAGVIGTIDLITTGASLTTFLLSEIETAYYSRAYQPADLFDACYVDPHNPLAVQLLGYGFIVEPLTPVRQALAANMLVRQWAGQVYQPNPGSHYTAAMTISAVAVGQPAGSTSYPELHCGGTLTYLGETDTAVFNFQEHITQGRFNCVDGVLISVSFISSNELNWKASKGRVAAFGTLTNGASS